MGKELAESKPDYLLEQPGYPTLPKRKNVSVRPISREVDLAWLAGIVDGEGNLDASVQEKKCGKTRRNYFQPKVRITNTDVRMVQAVSEIYVREGIRFFYAINSVKRYKNRQPTWRNQLEITVSAKVHIVVLLQLIIPYLRNKRRYAELLLEAIRWVDSQPRRGNGSAGQNYTELAEFWSHIEAMKIERDCHIDPSTTTRRAGEILVI